MALLHTRFLSAGVSTICSLRLEHFTFANKLAWDKRFTLVVPVVTLGEWILWRAKKVIESIVTFRSTC